MTATQTWLDVTKCDAFQKIDDIHSLQSNAIQSQYDNSPRLKRFCKIFQDTIDATNDLENAIQALSDPSVAQGIFLDWWGERVGASRKLTVNNEEILLDDDQYRFLIFYRAAANIADSSVYRMNVLLQQLLGVRVFVVDNLNMTISLRVLGEISQNQEFILRNYGLLTRGAGVGYEIITNLSEDVFGFLGSGLHPFNQRPFGQTSMVISHNEG
nr:MAG TPA: Protein of unknown function (DUF2612) [Caudoviricetes sp.]